MKIKCLKETLKLKCNLRTNNNITHLTTGHLKPLETSKHVSYSVYSTGR